MHAPRRKSCQALLPDGETPCSATFRGWGKYCTAHLEECAQLSGQCKDAAARVDRLRRTGELSDRQVRALTNAASVERAIDKVRLYLEALREEDRARAALLGRFPAEKDVRHEQRLTVVEERKTACSALIEQLQQHREEVLASSQQRRGRYSDAGQGDPERQPLLGRPRPSRLVWITLLVFLLIVVPTIFMILVLPHIGT